MFAYRNQQTNVRWNSNEKSRNFPIRNGTGQDRVPAAITYRRHVARLFEELKLRRAGCWLEGEYAAIWGYSDDNLGVRLSLSALQNMITTIEEYASFHNLKFCTDPNSKKCKTKCIAYLKKPRELPSMVLFGNLLPWGLRGPTKSTDVRRISGQSEPNTSRYVAKYCKSSTLCIQM